MGKRVPIGLKIFLTALAIVDDLGAVLSIAIFYTDTIHWAYLGFAGFIIILLFVLNRVGVRKIWVYLILGLVGVWYPLLMSGVHATIAGVLVALTIPANRKIRSSVFGKNLKTLIVEYGKLFDSEDNRVMSGNQMETIGSMKRICEQAESPLQKIEHILKPLALFVVMPLFALANTGIHFSFQDVGEVIIHPVFTGIAFGLIIGKSLGIFGFSWLAIKLKWVEIPDGVRLKQLFGAGLLAGIGFTMSLFITDLAFHGDALQIIAKKAIFLSSLIAGLVGMIWLRIVSKPSR